MDNLTEKAVAQRARVVSEMERLEREDGELLQQIGRFQELRKKIGVEYVQLKGDKRALDELLGDGPAAESADDESGS